jgi:hypothetical protein
MNDEQFTCFFFKVLDERIPKDARTAISNY